MGLCFQSPEQYCVCMCACVYVRVCLRAHFLLFGVGLHVCLGND